MFLGKAIIEPHDIDELVCNCLCLGARPLPESVVLKLSQCVSCAVIRRNCSVKS